MTWYAASLVYVFRVRIGPQAKFPVWEEVCLIEASDDDEALEKAEILGRERNAVDDETLTLNDVPATKSYFGIRKLLTIDNPFPASQNESPPMHGTEITFSDFTLESETDLLRFVRGQSVSLIYEE